MPRRDRSPAYGLQSHGDKNDHGVAFGYMAEKLLVCAAAYIYGGAVYAVSVERVLRGFREPGREYAEASARGVAYIIMRGIFGYIYPLILIISRQIAAGHEFSGDLMRGYVRQITAQDHCQRNDLAAVGHPVPVLIYESHVVFFKYAHRVLIRHGCSGAVAESGDKLAVVFDGGDRDQSIFKAFYPGKNRRIIIIAYIIILRARDKHAGKQNNHRKKKTRALKHKHFIFFI